MRTFDKSTIETVQCIISDKSNTTYRFDGFVQLNGKMCIKMTNGTDYQTFNVDQCDDLIQSLVKEIFAADKIVNPFNISS